MAVPECHSHGLIELNINPYGLATLNFDQVQPRKQRHECLLGPR
jgi:hypothetical protein